MRKREHNEQRRRDIAFFNRFSCGIKNGMWVVRPTCRSEITPFEALRDPNGHHRQMVERDFVHTLPRPPPFCKYFLYKSTISQGKAGVAKGSKATRLAIGWMCVHTSRRFESCPRSSNHNIRSTTLFIDYILRLPMRQHGEPTTPEPREESTGIEAAKPGR